MDFAVDESLAIDPRILKISREYDFVVFLDDFIDRFHDLRESFFSFFFEPDEAIIKSRFDEKEVSFFILVAMNKVIYGVNDRLVLAKLFVNHKICAISLS